ncbi:fumarylacetoacetate hydrolase [Priestia endophytica]|nr:fumarylacetoacetate hydrolase family protein [Priestia endophytica]RAS83744.1 fumarylacetoacetate hydrolase [Priestia endophytica]
MQQSFRNIYCVGRNYASFAEQMGNAMPEHPLIFMKPTHSVEKMNSNSLEFYGSRGEINCEAELVLHIGRTYEKGIQIEELVDKMTIGIDFTYRDVLNKVKKRGQPWLPAKGFPNSSAIGEFRSFTSDSVLQNDFKLRKNREILQVGNVKNMIFSLQTLIDFIAENFGLGAGDLIYTGTPEGIGTLQHNDSLEIMWGEETLGSCQILLK